MKRFYSLILIILFYFSAFSQVYNNSALYSIRVESGWNLLSLPSIVPDGQKKLIFPTAVSDAFMYQNSYIAKDTLENGVGYWLKFDSAETINITGSAILDDTIVVHKGWNLIGSLSVPVAVNTILTEPSGIVVSNAFAYVPGIGYKQTDTILSGQGYWVKVNQAGLIIRSNHSPDIPSNPNPVDYAAVQPINVTLSWSCSDPDGEQILYDVYFGTDNPPATIVSSNQSDSSLVRNNLNLSTTYYWMIVAKDGQSNSTASPVWRFTTNHPPNIPANPDPADDTVGRPINDTLRWTCSDSDNDPLGYDVYLGTDNPPATIVSSNQTNSSLVRNNLNHGTTYYWMVVAKDDHNDSTAGPVWRFTTNHPPSIPTEINPLDNAVGQPLNDTLSWTCSDTDGDPLAYDIYFGIENPPTLMVSSLHTDTSLIRSGLSSGTTYFWKVIAKDILGDSSEGPVWKFTTMGAPCTGFATIEYGGKTYNTVQIGSQCWLKENLDIGTMVDRLQDQSDNSVIEKYCYDNDTVNCSTYGGLYQWNEAMQYVHTAGAQGLCPSGWHIPAHAELVYLRSIVDSNGNALKAIGQGTGAGAGTNTSGFSTLLGGYRYPDGYFYDLGVYTAFWSSTENDPDILVTRFPLESENGDINLILNSTKDYGFNIRCIKD